ncbi:MAG: hypothetical protein KDI72_09515, partial [Xanthomonadales bacterium]|nr:hypothetical protein [Xanthomonadales bacterium]MCB1578450.1 hypothetical protein [Xanthomonadales bacterium]
MLNLDPAVCGRRPLRLDSIAARTRECVLARGSRAFDTGRQGLAIDWFAGEVDRGGDDALGVACVGERDAVAEHEALAIALAVAIDGSCLAQLGQAKQEQAGQYSHALDLAFSTGRTIAACSLKRKV